jgi:hypothetical protein
MARSLPMALAKSACGWVLFIYNDSYKPTHI